MTNLENLPEVTERALDGLKADDSLKTRILNAAIQKNNPSFIEKKYRPVPVLLTSIALMLLCVFLLNGKKPLTTDGGQNLIHSFTAGNSATTSISFEDFYDVNPFSVDSIELIPGGKTNDHNAIIQLIDKLKHESNPVANNDFVFSETLLFYDSNGLLFSLPVNSTYIKWSDGIRECNGFFEKLNNFSY